MTTTALQHEEYCAPRPGEDAARVEAYTASRDNEHGGMPIPAVRVVRCQECGAASYDGVQRGG